ncbi:MAG: LCP family protein [Gordonia sp. (in: high G+C Gram-positive bacteria)]|uniref:LCP family protein n=1 Tax=Gordonia sp. (in: high G+C Gram-positive bacteria) TaxID=84139 RepID=UPI0039E64021
MPRPQGRPPGPAAGQRPPQPPPAGQRPPQGQPPGSPPRDPQRPQQPQQRGPIPAPPTRPGPPQGPPQRYQPPQAWSAAPPAPQQPAQQPPAPQRPKKPLITGKYAPTQQPTPDAPPRQQPPGQQPPAAGQGRPPSPGQQPPAPPKKPLVTGKYAPTQTPQPVPVDERRPTRPPQRGANVTPAKRRPPSRPSTKPKPARPARSKTPRTKRRWTPRRIVNIFLVAVFLFIASAIGGLLYVDTRLDRINALSFSGRISNTPGTNWLIVGTDSREGMSAKERKRLSTGPDEGGIRTDTIMLISKPVKGPTAIISIPRDLYVDLPGGNGQHKINAAYSMGGPKLLVQTIESVSGVHIDHYAEIGFSGFANIVDAVGGVKICLKESLRDRNAGLRLKAGCQKINGKQALGLVRSRDFPRADLQRVINQRKVFSALVNRASSPAVLLNPFRAASLVNGTADALTVDRGDHSWDLARLAWSLRGSPLMVTVPTGGSEWTGDGDSLAVDDDTEEFFSRLAKGKAVSKSLVDDDDGKEIG